MAISTVVINPFFEPVIEVLEITEKKNGQLAFAMLHRTLSSPLHWSLTVASPWIDSASRLELTAELRESLKKSLGDMWPRLGSVLVRSTQDSIVRTLAPLLPVPELGTTYQVSPLELMFFDIDEAYILLSRPELLERITTAA